MPNDDPFKYFRVEAVELTELLTQGAAALEQGLVPPAGVAALLRHAHTLKGAARVVKQPEIGDQAHAIEDLLSPYRAPGAQPPVECGRALLERLAAIRALLASLGAPIERRNAKPSVADDLRTLRLDVKEIEAVVESVAEALAELEPLREALPVLDDTKKLSALLGRQLDAARSDDARRVAGARSIAGNLEQGLGKVERIVRSGFERLERALEQTHVRAERLRLIPVERLFEVLESAGREAAAELGLELVFERSGDDLRVNAHALGVAQRALLHVVRNVVAHGIEPPAERVAAGKPRAGSVRLGVRRDRRQVVFSCRDDGRGLDTSAVRRALEAAGVHVGGLGEAALLERLLESGVSTATGITGLSGRGLGLDVVRDAAETLGGSARLFTERGRGFGVELRLPITALSIPGLAVECEGRVLTVPLHAVLECARLRRDEISHGAEGDQVAYAGTPVPFAPLSRVLGATPGSQRDAWAALFVRGDGGTAAVGVDRLLGPRNVALQLLPEVARASNVVAGASLDALGQPELVLDPDGLVARIRRSAHREVTRRAPRRVVLVIDDSLTTRMLEQSILESAGYDVDLATSAEEALEHADPERHALFLVNVEMPGIDGFTFVERIRNDPRLGRIPAVLVSSRAAPEDLARGKALGAAGYMVKDRFDQKELLSLIARLVGPA